MTIARRLQLLLSTLLGALILIGTLAVVQMHLQSRSINFINTKVVPSLAVIDEIETNFAILRSTVLRHILSNNSQDMSKIEEEIGLVRSEIDADLKEYQESLIINDEDRQLFLDGENRILQYYSVVDEVLPLSKSFQTALAAEKILTARPMIDAVAQALDNHSDYNLQLTNREGSMAEARVVRDGLIILGILVIATATALFLSLSTCRRIVGSLEAMRAAMTDIVTHLDFTKRLAIGDRDEVADTAKTFNGLLDKFQDSLKTMRSWAEQVNAYSAELSFAAQQVSAHSGEQSKAASNMATTAEELAANVNRVSDRAREVNTLTVRAGTTAQKGITAVEQILDDIRYTQSVVVPVAESVIRLDEDSYKVSAAVSLINGIADQTGQLASRASRSGQADHEFSDVACEIQELVEYTAHATQDISATVASMQADADQAIDGALTAIAQVEKSVKRAMVAESAIRDIASGSEQIVLMAEEIAEAIHKQNAACQAIAKQVEYVAHISEENTAIAQNTASHSKELHDIAKAMRDEAALYQV